MWILKLRETPGRARCSPVSQETKAGVQSQVGLCSKTLLKKGRGRIEKGVEKEKKEKEGRREADMLVCR